MFLLRSMCLLVSAKSSHLPALADQPTEVAIREPDPVGTPWRTISPRAGWVRSCLADQPRRKATAKLQPNWLLQPMNI